MTECPLISTDSSAVLRSLRTIFEQSDKNQKHVSVCGEMAGEPIYAALLIGLGAKSLSVSVSRLPEIKHYIRLMNLGELKKLTNDLMTLDQAELIEQKLSAFLENLKAKPSIDIKDDINPCRHYCLF